MVALGHSWYPQECCSDKDCFEVACADLITQADGSIIYDGITFTKDKIKSSLDAMCHVCFSPTTRTPFCLFQSFSF